VRGQIVVTDATVIGTFADRGPAMTTKAVGQGRAIHLAYLPGLSYFGPAVPRRPVDRGSTDDAMAHFIPTAFNTTTRTLLISLLPADLARPVTCSEPLVEASVIDAPQGWLIPLVKWSAGPQRGLKVTLKLGATPKSITLASGAPVQVQTADGALELTLDLDAADALILTR
jgi:hypothetical protein